MSNDLDQTIRDNANGPAQAANDTGSMEQHRLTDQIAADRFLNSKQATRRKGLGIKLTKAVPPGAS